MKNSSKEKELQEKNRQIQILNELIQMNAKQALSQCAIIDELKKV